MIYISRVPDVELNKESSYRNKVSKPSFWKLPSISCDIYEVSYVYERRRILIRNGDQGFELCTLGSEGRGIVGSCEKGIILYVPDGVALIPALINSTEAFFATN